MTSPTLAAPSAETPGIADATQVEPVTTGIATRRISIGLNTVIVLLVGLLITAALSLGARAVNASSEERLLGQRVRAAAAVLTSAMPRTETPRPSAG